MPIELVSEWWDIETQNTEKSVETESIKSSADLSVLAQNIAIWVLKKSILEITTPIVWDSEQQTILSQSLNNREDIASIKQELIEQIIFEKWIKFDWFANEKEWILWFQRINTDINWHPITEINGIPILTFMMNKIKNKVNKNLAIYERPMRWIDKAVLHSTANNPISNPTTKQSINQINWTNDTTPSAHFLVAKDGTIHQTATLSTIINHAGKSIYSGDSRLDESAIGIEVETTEYEERNAKQKESVKNLLIVLWQQCPNINKKNIVPHALVWVSKYWYGRKSDPVDTTGKLFNELWLPNQRDRMLPDLILGVTSDNLIEIKKDKWRSHGMYTGLEKTKKRIENNPIKVKEIRKEYITKLITDAKNKKSDMNYTVWPDKNINKSNYKIIQVIRNNSSWEKELIRTDKYADLEDWDEVILIEWYLMNPILLMENEGINQSMQFIKREQDGHVTSNVNPFYEIGKTPGAPCAHVLKQSLWRSYNHVSDKLTPQALNFFGKPVDAWYFFDELEKLWYHQHVNLKWNLDTSMRWLLSRNPIRNSSKYNIAVKQSIQDMKQTKPWEIMWYYFIASHFHYDIVKRNRWKQTKRANTHLAMVVGQTENIFNSMDIQRIFDEKKLWKIPKSLQNKWQTALFLSKIIFSRLKYKESGKIGIIKRNLLGKYAEDVEIQISDTEWTFHNWMDFTWEINENTSIKFAGTLMYDFLNNARTLFYREQLLLGDLLPTESYELKNEQLFFKNKIKSPFQEELEKNKIVTEFSFKNGYRLKKGEMLSYKLRNHLMDYYKKLKQEWQITDIPDTYIQKEIYEIQLKLLEIHGKNVDDIEYHKYLFLYDIFKIENNVLTIRDTVKNFVTKIEKEKYLENKKKERIENIEKVKQNKKNFLDISIEIQIWSWDSSNMFLRKIKEESAYYLNAIYLDNRNWSWDVDMHNKSITIQEQNTMFFLMKKILWSESAAIKFIQNDKNIFIAGTNYNITLRDIYEADKKAIKLEKSMLPVAKVDDIDTKISQLLNTSDQNKNILNLIARKEWYADWGWKRKLVKHSLEWVESSVRQPENEWDYIEKIFDLEDREFVSSRWLHQLRFNFRDVKSLKEIERCTKADLEGAFEFVIKNYRTWQLQDYNNLLWDGQIQVEKDVDIIKKLQIKLKTKPYTIKIHKEIINKFKFLMKLTYFQDVDIVGKMLSYYLTDKYITVNSKKLNIFLTRTWDVPDTEEKQKKLQFAIMRMHNLWQTSSMYGYALNYLIRLCDFLWVDVSKMPGMVFKESRIKWNSLSIWENQFKKNLTYILSKVKKLKDIDNIDIKTKKIKTKDITKIISLIETFCTSSNRKNYWNNSIDLVNETRELNAQWLDVSFLPTESEINDTKNNFRSSFFWYIRDLDKYTK